MPTSLLSPSCSRLAHHCLPLDLHHSKDAPSLPAPTSSAQLDCTQLPELFLPLQTQDMESHRLRHRRRAQDTISEVSGERGLSLPDGADVAGAMPTRCMLAEVAVPGASLAVHTAPSSSPELSPPCWVAGCPSVLCPRKDSVYGRPYSWDPSESLLRVSLWPACANSKTTPGSGGSGPSC